MTINIGEHYESRIEVLKNEKGELVIKKTYDNNVPCIRFLNTLLAEKYPERPTGMMPVAAHEFTILKYLEPFRIAPKPLGIQNDSIFMTFEGNPVTDGADITKEEYLWQAKNILHVLHASGIRHNDMLDRNVLIKDGIIKIIDFTLSEYGDIDIASRLPDHNWARLNQDYKLLTYKKFFPDHLSPEILANQRKKYLDIGGSVYNYHNLGVGIYDDSEKEKTPYGYGERYNFDRMAMMVMNYDFTHKNIVDLGCNSGWFSFQSALLGAKNVVGVDYELEGKMGESIRYARAFANYLQAPVKIVDQNLEFVDLAWLAHSIGSRTFDATIILSVLHHIKDKKKLFTKIYNATKEVIFYEDHEFWNEIYDDKDNLIAVKGEGHRYGWNEDMSWQRKIGSLEKHEKIILKEYFNSWRKDELLLDRYSNIKLLGFSEKRRPMLAFFK